MTDTDVQDNRPANLFPHVTGAEATAGLDRYRKYFIKKDDGTFNAAKYMIDCLSLADDYFRIKEGTYNDTQAEADDYTDWAGSGEAAEDLDTESGATDPFEVTYDVANGVYAASLIAVIDWDDLDVNGDPSIEYLTVAAGGVAWVGTTATLTTETDCVAAHSMKTKGTVTGTQDENFDLDGLTLVISINGGADQTITFAADGMTAAEVETFINLNLTGGTASASGTKVEIVTDDYYLANSIQVKASSTGDTELGLDNSIHYGTDGTVIATVLELGDIASAVSEVTATTAGDGDYDNSGHPIVSYDKGSPTTASKEVICTFTSATEFGCTVSGVNVGTGDTTADFSPAHWGSYYFLIDKDGWSGTWASGDKLEFTLTGSYYAVWMREIVGAGTDAYSGNRVSCTLDGEEA